MDPDQEFEKWRATALRRDIIAAEQDHVHRNLTEQRLRIPIELIMANERYIRAVGKGRGDPKKLFKKFFGIDQEEFEAALAAEEDLEAESPSATSTGVRLLQRSYAYMLKLASLSKFGPAGPEHSVAKIDSAKLIEARKKLQAKHRDDSMEARWTRLSAHLRSIRGFLSGLADDLQSPDFSRKSDTSDRLVAPYKNVVLVLATMPPPFRPRAFCEILQGRSEFARSPVVDGKELRVKIPLHVPVFEPTGLKWKFYAYDNSSSTWVPATTDLLDLDRLRLEDLALTKHPLAIRLFGLVTNSEHGSIADDWNIESFPFFKSISKPKGKMTWQDVVRESMRIFGEHLNSSNELAEVLGLLRIDDERFTKFLVHGTDRVSLWESAPTEDVLVTEFQRLYSGFNRRTKEFRTASIRWIPEKQDLAFMIKAIRRDSCFRKVSNHHLADHPVFQTAIAERMKRIQDRKVQVA
jgi:hypothetical protein